LISNANRIEDTKLTHAIPEIAVPDDLKAIQAVYEAAGETLWLVGGRTRDHVMGVPCKDTDLATTATPERQVAICDAAGLRWIGTGLKHGTLTILGDEPYEITTLRTDVETDGRHATVAWATEIETDLARRDLTVNAIAMTFDGQVVDPFGGVDDCLARRVRFVGDAETRIREDHLRILRWFRFLGRFGPDAVYDVSDLDAIGANAALLRSISVERIWSEMRRILVGPQAVRIVRLMAEHGVLYALDMSLGVLDDLERAVSVSDDPVAILAAWQRCDSKRILERWKASRTEIDAARFVSSRLLSPYGMGNAMVDLVDGEDRDLALFVLRLRGKRRALKVVETWKVPVFPIKGGDLIAEGMVQGVEMGRRLNLMKARWMESGFSMTAEELMSIR
jgi:tRNA nucleotidyltransferase/poly(A) polymerase